MSELICLSLVNICTQGWKRFALNVFQDSGIEFLPEQLSGRVERGEGGLYPLEQSDPHHDVYLNGQGPVLLLSP